MLEREGIEQRFAARTRPRIDHPRPRVAPSSADWWDQVAVQLNSYLDHSTGIWPRLTGPQLAIFVGCLEIAADELA